MGCFHYDFYCISISASCRFYCSLPELKWVFFSLWFDNAQYPLFLPGDNKLHNLTVVLFTQPNELPRGSGRVLSLRHLLVHTIALHIHEHPVFFCFFFLPTIQTGAFVCHRTHSKQWHFPSHVQLFMPRGYKLTIKPCNS